MALKEGNKRVKWEDRVPYAYWKGNPHVSPIRADLMRCNFSDKYDPMVCLYVQVYIHIYMSIYTSFECVFHFEPVSMNPEINDFTRILKS